MDPVDPLPPDHSQSVPSEPPSAIDKSLSSPKTFWAIFRDLSWPDRLLGPIVLLAMILGVIIGEFAGNVNVVLTSAKLNGVSVPIAIGLIVMMWPILTKVQYERLPFLLRSRNLWRQVAWSIGLNWLVGPFVMLALAWATLPDLPTYRTGVIMVGLARCIAMVLLWSHLAGGHPTYCALLVIINSLLQILLYSPLSLLFINVISREKSLSLEYGRTAIAVLVYLGIPLAAGVVTRFGLMRLLGRDRFEEKFLPIWGPVAMVGLVYTIILIFASQAQQILHNLGPVFRVFVPLILYFVIMWLGTFIFFWRLSLSRHEGQGERKYGYELAVVQAFTAASNNFELAIAVCIAIYGVDSEQALAATIGPLVEVPVMLLLSYVALWLRGRLRWVPAGVETHEKDTRSSEA